MNELLSIIQNIAKPQVSPLSLMEMPTIHFRDILQLLLLSAAVHIVKRTYPDQKGD